MNVIIYKQDNGRVAVVVPTNEALEEYSIEDIAAKSVSAGRAFKIVDFETLPTGIPQEEWDIDDAEFTDGVGAESKDHPLLEKQR